MAKTNKQPSKSLFAKRWHKFMSIRRGYYSLLILFTTYGLSFLLPLFVGNTALIVHYEGKTWYPLFQNYISASELGQDRIGSADYRALQAQYKEQDSGNWVLMPFYPFGPKESLLDMPGTPPHRPDSQHLLGTDDRARDVLSRLLYGYRTSISFALIVTLCAYTIGISLGGMLGYYGGTFDILVQRGIEIWSSIPFLFMIMIISSLINPNFWMLTAMLIAFQWMGMTYYVRGEFYREKSKDYVQAAVSMGASDRRIIFKHILPNSLTPVISFMPFAIVANIGSLVSLDFLGFGLPPEDASWGSMVKVGMANITDWWLVLAPLAALFCTLMLVVFIGEAIREAFDPKVYSRLR